jgi:hypothetical protein
VGHLNRAYVPVERRTDTDTELESVYTDHQKRREVSNLAALATKAKKL